MKALMLAVFLSFFSILVHAEFRIDDPSGILGQTTTFLGPVKFQDAFKVGDEMQGITQSCRLICRGGDCKEVCSTPFDVVSKVASTSDVAATLSTSTAGEEPSDYTVTREVFEKVGGNWIRLYLEQGLANGGKPGEKDFATIQKSEDRDFSLADGSALKTKKVWIEYNKWNDDSEEFKVTQFALSVAKDVPAVGQLVEVHDQPAKLKTPLFKVTAVKR